jgi:membrane protein implicated in regulation of membrane protease activity
VSSTSGGYSHSRPPIENGFGKVRVGDTLWRVKGDDAPAGDKVEVTGTDGVLLLVRKKTD